MRKHLFSTLYPCQSVQTFICSFIRSFVHSFFILSDVHSVSVSEPSQSIEMTLWWPTWWLTSRWRKDENIRFGRKYWPPTQTLTRFLISRGQYNFHFSWCSRLSRFWRTNSRSPLGIRDFEDKFLFSNEWDFANIFSFSSQDSKFWEKKFTFSSQFFPSISLPILGRNQSLLFWLILTSSVLQKGKVFPKDSSVLLSNILSSVNKSTSWRLPTRAFCGNILRGCTTEKQYNG